MNQTRAALLQEAETLIRTRGYVAFSYADLSGKVGIAKASIHHHFPTKEALGVALVDEYLERFAADLDELGRRKADAMTKLDAYGEFFAGGLRGGLMPLCGALASDISSLPAPMRSRVERFFKLHLDWLEGVIRAGVSAGELRADIEPARASRSVLSALQGSSLVAWALGEPGSVKAPLSDLLKQLAA